MLSIQQLSLSYAPAAALTTPRTARVMPQMANTADELETLAKELNPVVGYWDPLGIGKIAKSLPGDEQATIGWWRHAEIKHGRVAMAAFVGFCVQSNGYHLPGALTTSGVTYADISAAGGPGEQSALLNIPRGGRRADSACAKAHDVRSFHPGQVTSGTPSPRGPRCRSSARSASSRPSASSHR